MNIAGAIRRIERLLGRGPYTRLDRIGNQLTDRDRTITRLTDELDVVRTRRDEIQARLAHTRAQLAWQPVTELGWADPDAGRRLWYPDTGAPNPLLRILYGRLPDVGIWPTPRREPLGEDMRPGDLLHLHWSDHVVNRENTTAAADHAKQTFLSRIDDVRRQGVKLICTVHELEGHDNRYPELVEQLRTSVYQRADAIHVLHESTVAEVIERFNVDSDRIFTVQHPFYTGWYPDIIDRRTARTQLGVVDDEILLLCFGAIREYKGFDRVVDHIDDIQERVDKPVKLLIAGPPPVDDTAYIDRLTGSAASRPSVMIHAQRVPDDNIAPLFRAADLTVLPYRPGALNSGVMMLSLTFGTPVVAPENSVTQALSKSSPAALFDASADFDLIRAIDQVVHQEVGLKQAGIDGMTPDGVASQFARALNSSKHLTHPASTVGTTRPGRELD